MKITELVKTYKLLSDPNAPDWNVKFVGGVVVALAVIAAAGAIVYNSLPEDAERAPAAAATTEGDAPRECTAEEVALVAGSGRVPEPGERLDIGCVVPA